MDITEIGLFLQPGFFHHFKFFIMKIIVLISEILAIVLLLVIAYIMTLAWKGRLEALKTVKAGIDQLTSQHEPDELIETWQEGYVIGIKDLLDSYAARNEPMIVWMVNEANNLTVIKKMGLKFYLYPADVHFYKPYIYIHDENKKRQWEAKHRD